MKLWSQFEQLENIKAKLVDVVKGQGSSSFRIVTGGMFGLQEMKKPTTESGTEKFSESVDQDQVMTVKEDAVGTIVREAVSLVHSENSIVAVVCPEKAARCLSLESLFKQNVHLTRKVIPVYRCPGLTQETMYACEKQVV